MPFIDLERQRELISRLILIKSKIFKIAVNGLIAEGEKSMLSRTISVLLAVALASVVLPLEASARGGGFHGGGFHGGAFHGGGFRGGGWGLGFYGPYGYPFYPFGYDDYYYGGETSCYLVRQRIHTRHGWRVRRVQICD